MEFLLVLIVYPIFVILASVFGYFLFRKWFVFPSITLIVFLILTIFVYNTSFLIWAIIYTVMSLIFSLIIDYFQKKEPQY
ncbi:DUF2651 family protein [Oceanobacillus sp. 1P07AA]|uniref:DUF2651 family protein n=1 Tax=Oceanobacillus sp. 1P07AA TaxID=3132293 RepID=UPI0039A74BFF